MPTFTVKCRVDAFIDYVAEVEAETPEEAAEIAGDGDHKWERDGEQEFDAHVYVALDKNGNEIEGTQCGDF
jgi:exonuclease VII large subunit